MKVVDCALLLHWLLELEEFDFVVEHCLRKSQKHIDALSQLPVGRGGRDQDQGHHDLAGGCAD